MPVDSVALCPQSLKVAQLGRKRSLKKTKHDGLDSLVLDANTLLAEMGTVQDGLSDALLAVQKYVGGDKVGAQGTAWAVRA